MGAGQRQRWLAKRIKNPEVLTQTPGSDAATLAAFFSDARQGPQADSLDAEPELYLEGGTSA